MGQTKGKTRKLRFSNKCIRSISWTYKLGYQCDAASKKINPTADCTDRLKWSDHRREKNPTGCQLGHSQIWGTAKKYSEVSEIELSDNHILCQAVYMYANPPTENLVFPML